MKKCKKFGLLATTGLASVGILASSQGKQLEQKYNVLFVAVADLRPELGCCGHEEIITPNIDALAARGTLFKRAYCQVAVCGASRASLLTGLRPTAKRFISYHAWAEKEVPDAMTLPQEFRKNGYYTISNGKVFHNNLDTASRSWDEMPWRSSHKSITFLDPSSQTMKVKNTKLGPFCEWPEVPDNAYEDGDLADKTISDLKRISATGKSFFLACGFKKPHLPFYAPKKYWDLYNRNSISIADNRHRPENAPESLQSSSEITKYNSRGIEYNSEEWHKTARHGYYACVSYVDAQLGRILDTLDELNLRDNTIIILWGDHGWHLGEHNFWGKHTVMHRAANAPLIIAGPGIIAGQTSSRLVEFVDIYPTLCELADIQTINKGIQGISFAPLLKDPDRAWKKAAFSSYRDGVNVITERYNYAEYANGEKMLYDLKNDPEENVNVAGLEQYSPVVNELSQLLHDGWTATLPSK